MVLFKGNETSLQGSFLQDGDLAPDFSLVNENLESVTLENFRGKQKILFTVPSIDTMVCAKEAKKINELAISHPTVLFLVISHDLPFAFQRFCKSEDLQNIVPLSNMRTKSSFGRNYGLLIASGPLCGLLARSVIYLDEGDKVIYSELVSEITEEPNYEALLAKLSEKEPAQES